ncbi:MAG: neutral zinc metallopeptidase [Actinomycetota bacterium]|nr:neutral zinc metallopeptidase [Actinomycetota bacterium]
MAISLLVISGCTVPQAGVEATRSRQNEDGNLIQSNDPQDTTVDTTVDTTPIPVQEGIIDFGSSKAERDYDGYLTAAFTDIDAFWKEQFPAVYGSEFEPLSGGIYAAYPERTEPIPGCGAPETIYAEVEGNAFYCVDGDFMAYDDEVLLPQLVDDLGQSAVAVVLAHEFGHAVQFRATEFQQPTILKEQQADCFAGAWAAHVSRGESDDISFSDDDISGGLIAMIQVRDPVELGGQIDANSHGTGFDRVGAFQDGFAGGAERCKSFFTEGRENLMINIPFDDRDPNAGNLPLVDANPDPENGPQDVVTLLPGSLTRFWTEQLAASNLTLTAPTLTVFSPGDGSATCDGVDSSQFENNIVYCTASNTIFVDQQFAEESIGKPLLGDMSVGYLISEGYSENVQALLGSNLAGEPRVLLDDCLTGAWSKDISPPIPPDREDQTSLSAGDLDEAIVTAIVRSDETADTDVNGSAFEKIDAFRAGVLGGMQACQARIAP